MLLDQSKLNAEQIQLMEAAETINTSNLHLRTNATWGQKVDFESLWYNHTPNAARIMLFGWLVYGKIQLI